MDMSLFRESISQHSSRLKHEYDDNEFNAVLAKAAYYGEATIKHIDTAITTFKEKASSGVTYEVYREGLADIGKAIWTAIIKVAQAIVRIAVNVKMFFLGGEKGLIKRIEKVRDAINKNEQFTGNISVPILKGTKGLSGFHELMTIVMDLVSGNAYLDAKLGGNGELSWDYKKSASDKHDRMEMFKDIDSSIGNPKYLNTVTADMNVRGIPQDASLLDVISMPTRLVTILAGDNSAISKTMGNAPDLDVMAKNVKYIKSGISKNGINPQLIASVGGKHDLKSIVEFKRLKGITKTSASKALDAIIDIAHKAFEGNVKGNVKKGKASTYNFEGYMRRIIKGGNASIKQTSKVAKSKGTSPELVTKIQHISRECHTVMNVLLNDYMEIVKDSKLLMHQVVQSLEKTDFKPIGSTNYNTDGESKTNGNPIIAVDYFKASIKKGDAFAVRSIIADMIARVKGDEKILNDAIDYAIQEGISVWEPYDGRVASTKWENIKQEYNFEKGRLVGNFCEERFDHVLELYKTSHHVY